MSLRKILSIALIALFALGTFAGAAVFAFAAGQPYRADTPSVDRHKKGAEFTLVIHIRSDLQHSIELKDVEINGLDVLACQTNWPYNKVNITSTGNKFTFTVSDLPGANLNFVGLSADLTCQVRVQDDFVGLSKVGVYTLPATKSSLVSYLAEESRYRFPGNWDAWANIGVEADATEFTVQVLAWTDQVVAYIGKWRMGSCDLTATISGVEDCTIKAPKGTTFGDFAGRPIVTLKFHDLQKSPSDYVGLDLP